MRDLLNLCQAASAAKYELQALTTDQKNNCLLKCAEALLTRKQEIMDANALDLKRGEENGMRPAMMDRLLLNEARISGMAEGIRQIVTLPDPIGEILEESERPNGLALQKVRVPMGVIGIIFESRPNVTADAFALTFKTGNVVVLKGGSDALSSNQSIVRIFKDVLKSCGITEDAVSLIENTDRAVTQEFMKMKEYVDLLIPRGGAGLIRSVVENATIPVIETGTGNCHIYVDREADLEMAVNIIFNAKTQRIGVCNACESLVIHQDVTEAFLPMLQKKLSEKSVELRGDQVCCDVLGSNCVPATEADWGTEYLDYILSMKTVSSVEEAIAHINRYNTHHSEAIITENSETAEKFLNGVDAACVYWNASTRFTDGFEFGLGAEIGISTQKLHARGPMGLKEMTSYKYKIRGNGQVRP